MALITGRPPRSAVSDLRANKQPNCRGTSTVKVMFWPASSIEPAKTSVANPGITCAPDALSTFSHTVSLRASNEGLLLTGTTVTVNVCTSEVSTPPLSVPPESCILTLKVAVPCVSGATSRLSKPSAQMATSELWLQPHDRG